MKENKIRCASCSFWRDKGWDGDEGIGICENPLVIDEVKMMSEEMIRRFVTGETEKEKRSNSMFISSSLRFHSNFGCIHHKNI